MPAVSDIDKKSVVRHSLNMPEIVLEQSQADGQRERFEKIVHSPRSPLLIWPPTDRDPLCKAQEQAM